MSIRFCQPYNDDYMVFDKLTGHYVLTEIALLQKGIDLRGRISDAATVSPEQVIAFFLETASQMVYNYIHSHSVHNELQDRLIATVPELRSVIQRAMLYQAVYMSYVGRLDLSTKDDERNKAMDNICIDILNTKVECLGTSILYTGV